MWFGRLLECKYTFALNDKIAQSFSRIFNDARITKDGIICRKHGLYERGLMEVDIYYVAHELSKKMIIKVVIASDV